MKDDTIKYYREDAKVLMVRGGGNKAGRFMEVAVYVEGGRKRLFVSPRAVRGGASVSLRVRCCRCWRLTEESLGLGTLSFLPCRGSRLRPR